MTPRFLLIVRRRLAIGLVLALAALAVAGTLRAEDAPIPGMVALTALRSLRNS